MGLYARSNAGTARLVALGSVILGYALVAESTRPSGFAFALAGVILFFGIPDEVSSKTTGDILPTIAFFALVALGVVLFANGV